MKRSTQPLSRRNAIILTSSLTTLALSACSRQPTSESSQQPPTTPPAETSSPSPIPTETSTPTSAPSATTSTTATDPSTSPTSGFEDRASSGPTSATGAPADTQGRDLTLEDFFEPPHELRQDLFNVATSSGINGIGADLEGSQGVQAELRLENRFTKLTFKAGQANSSKSSDLILRIGTYKDNKNDKLIDIPFNEIKPIEIDVSKVNALKIELLPLTAEKKTSYGSGSITGVMFDMRLE